MPLYETHLPVSDLTASLAFYHKVVGLVPAFQQPERGVAFLWVDAPDVGMLGLWGPGSTWGWKPGETHRCHFALTTPLEDLPKKISRLRALGIETFGFDGNATTEPSVIGWMPSAQIYFRDPDGHVCEFIAPLPDKPVESFFGTLSAWEKLRAEKR